MAINLRRVDLNLLTVFDAIMQARNLSRAGENVGMSQPAVSDALSRLRHLLNDELFIRTGHGVKPTASALHYGKQISHILDITKMMLTEEQDFDCSKSQRTFNLALRDYGELVALPRLVQWLEQRQANIGLNTLPQSMAHNLDNFRQGKLDISLSSEPIGEDDFHNVCVYTESLVSMVSVDHAIVKDELSLEQFLALPHIILDWPELQGSMVEQRLRALNLKRQCRMRVHSFFDMPRVVSNSQMIASVPSRMAQHFAQAHKLKTFATPIEDLGVPIYLSWHKSQHADSGHRWLREALQTFLS